MGAEHALEERNSNTSNQETVSNGNFASTGNPNKSHKIALSAIVVLAIAAVVGGIFVFQNHNADKKSQTTVTASDLSEEQKKKLGINTENETKTNTSEIEDENNYSEEYKKYLELPEEEKEKLEVIPRKENVPEEKIEEIKEETDDEVIAALPDSFDLRNTIGITVGYQGKYGLCWAYASAKALETHLALRGIDYNPSELQVDFLASTLMYGNRTLHDGGSFEEFADIASSIGTISETTFSNLGINPDENFSIYDTDNSYLKLINNDSPVYITKTVDFPALYKSNGLASGISDEEIKAFRDLVKAHIMKNGALYAVLDAPDNVFLDGEDGNRKYYYTPSSEFPNTDRGNHAMAIVGWDDNFSKDNFKGPGVGEGIEKPLHNGAYLVLNSWGGWWGDSGYYWVSYDEYNVESQLSGVVSTSLKDAKKIDDIPSSLAKNIVEEKLGFYIIDNSGEKLISDYALNRLSFLELSSRNLDDNDFNDIAEAFPNTTSLNVSDNKISDLTPLTKLKNLNYVNLSKNSIKDISVICNMGVLDDYGFNISYNQIADVSCLADKYTNDSYLDISGNVGVTGYEKITTLSSLSIDNIGIESLEPLSALKNLYYLSARNNNIKNLSGLNTDHDFMNEIILSGNKGLTNLSFDKPVSYLDVSDSGLTDISILNDIKASTVHAERNNFGDLSGFNNDSIFELSLSGNKNLSNYGALDKIELLYLSDCGIKSLAELGGLKKVETLSLDNNEIKSLDGLSELISLRDLKIDNNRLASLDGISDAEQLQTISADNNEISDAGELYNLRNLYFASFNNNKISSIPVANSQSGIHLALANNPLGNAVIPSGIASINLDDCNLSAIDYSSANNLSYISLLGNPEWKDYGALMSEMARMQQGVDGGAFINISTDYCFSKDEIDGLAAVKEAYSDNMFFSVNIKEAHSDLQKTANGIIYLENNPFERRLFMRLLKDGRIMDGISIDRAAIKVVLKDSSMESIVFKDCWTDLDSRIPITTDTYIFDLSY